MQSNETENTGKQLGSFERFSLNDWTSEMRLMLFNSSKSADTSPPIHIRIATS
jgi:hypothetical protein